jgi:hypothetical protein
MAWIRRLTQILLFTAEIAEDAEKRFEIVGWLRQIKEQGKHCFL